MFILLVSCIAVGTNTRQTLGSMLFAIGTGTCHPSRRCLGQHPSDRTVYRAGFSCLAHKSWPIKTFCHQTADEILVLTAHNLRTSDPSLMMLRCIGEKP